MVLPFLERRGNGGQKERRAGIFSLSDRGQALSLHRHGLSNADTGNARRQKRCMGAVFDISPARPLGTSQNSQERARRRGDHHRRKSCARHDIYDEMVQLRKVRHSTQRRDKERRRARIGRGARRTEKYTAVRGTQRISACMALSRRRIQGNRAGG